MLNPIYVHHISSLCSSSYYDLDAFARLCRSESEFNMATPFVVHATFLQKSLFRLMAITGSLLTLDAFHVDWLLFCLLEYVAFK